MRAATAIAAVNLRRLFRDRTSTFFVFVFPFLIILAIGAVFGEGFTPKLGVAAGDRGPIELDLLERLRATDGIEVRELGSGAELLEAVERGEVEAGVVVPPGYDRELESGGEVTVQFLARPAGPGQELRLTVASVVDQQAGVIRAARFAAEESDRTFEEALEQARSLAGTLPQVTVRVTVAGREDDQEDFGTFGAGAAQQLVLFMFVTSLAASSQLIETRRLGVSRRMLATPSSAGAIIGGEALGRFAVGLFQGLLIVVVSLLLFGVNWGDPLATLAIVVAFALVGTGAAMLMGSVLNNAEQAGSLGVFLGLGLAALGGCMVPLEIFPPTMERVAHVTPHAWAVEGLFEVVGAGASIGDVLPQIGILLGYAAVLLALATLGFRRAITGTAVAPTS